jgi:hypothetical protein
MAEHAAPDNAQIESASDFKSDARGLQDRWTVEIGAAKKESKKWRETARKLIDRFLDKRKGNEDSDTRVNLFSANLQTQRAMMYGRTPRVDVNRRFEDGNDAVARVAAQILERLLNTSIEDDTDNFAAAIALALDDRLLVGLGNVRLRYEAEFEEQDEVPAQQDEAGNELAPGYQPPPKKTYEDVEVDYIHWDDQLWSPARTFGEVRWWGFGVYMTLDQLKKRFGEKKARSVPLSRKANDRKDSVKHDPWARARVIEVWSKEDRKVYWWAEGCEEILDVRDDPLGLDGFFPFPKPMIANATTDCFMPRPDFIFSQDLYNEIDYVSTRITLLERAVKVVGVYDKSADGVRRILTEGFDNDLIAVDNWQLFAERGGLKGQIDWLPVDVVVQSLDKLREYRAELIKLLYEVTGMSDIMRGEQQPGETATTSALKARFASVRMQSSQDEFARFATDVLKLKAEIIVKHCDDETILAESNIGYTADAQLAQQAVQLLRTDAAKYRIEVKPENISMQDFDMLKSERVAFLQGLTSFLQAAAPVMGAEPAAGPYLLEMLKWGMSGFRGSSTIEGVLDQAIAAMRQAAMQPKQPQEDPKLQAQREKAQLDVGVAKEKAKVEIGKIQQKQQLDQQKIGIEAARANMQLQKMAAEARMKAMTGMGMHQPEGPPAPGGM